MFVSGSPLPVGRAIRRARDWHGKKFFTPPGPTSRDTAADCGTCRTIPIGGSDFGWRSSACPTRFQTQRGKDIDMAGNVIEFTDANFDEEVLKSDVPVLVDFWAPW